MNYLPNVNAEREFQLSGLPDTERIRRAIRADALYMMNHVNCTFSAAVASACHNFPNLASPIALSILAESDDDEEKAQYEAYVRKCEAELCEPHTFHMWQVHGRPEGPLG